MMTLVDLQMPSCSFDFVATVVTAATIVGNFQRLSFQALESYLILLKQSCSLVTVHSTEVANNLSRSGSFQWLAKLEWD